MTIRTHEKNFDVPILEDQNVPARSEIIKEIPNKSKIPQIILSQELGNGIFSATSISNEAQTFVRIINTNSTDQYINFNQIKTSPSSDFHVFKSHIDSNEKYFYPDRIATLINILKPTWPNYVETDMTNLCTEFADIFQLETDIATTNNFYKQNIPGLHQKLSSTTFLHNRNQQTS